MLYQNLFNIDINNSSASFKEEINTTLSNPKMSEPELWLIPVRFLSI